MFAVQLIIWAVIITGGICSQSSDSNVPSDTNSNSNTDSKTPSITDSNSNAPSYININSNSDSKPLSNSDRISEHVNSEPNVRTGFGAPWLAWHEGPCSVSCGLGTLIRTRNCSNANPQTTTETCIGMITEADICHEAACPVIDGGWSDWGNHSCSVTCGHGTQYQFRSCTNPKPASGGTDCDGASNRTVGCFNSECPVDGGWSAWTVNQCSVDCGVGITSKTRNCSNPLPEHGGNECHGEDEVLIRCSQSHCPVDGEWTQWIATCIPVIDRHGVQVRERSCTNPRPQNGGSSCSGKEMEHSSCETSKQQACTGTGRVWLPNSGVCIYVSDVAKTQYEALQICKSKSLGGRLIHIKNADMLQELHGHLTSSRWYSIDGSDADHEGSWVNSDGNPMWTNWQSGYPNGGTARNYVLMYGAEYFYEDTTYTDPNWGYICEIMTG